MLKVIFRTLRFHGDQDEFDRESEEGLRMFPFSGVKIFKIKIKLKFLIVKTIWAALSMPLKIYALSGTIIAVSGSTYFVSSIYKNAMTSQEQEQPIHSDNFEHHNTFVSEPVSETSEEKQIIHYYNDEQLDKTNEYIQFTPTIIIRNIDLLSLNEPCIKYSTLSEFYIGNFKFTDFSKLHNNNKSILIPVFGGLEARYENSDHISAEQNFFTSDSTGYYSFFDKLANCLNRQNYTEAGIYLNMLNSQFPEDENAIFYKGYIHYCKNEYAKAEGYFLKCEHSRYKSFYHEAKLYRVYIYTETGKIIEALNLIDQIDQENSPFKKEAAQIQTKITNKQHHEE